MNFERYLKGLLNKYIIKRISLNEYDALFDKFKDLIIKKDNYYLTFSNCYNLDLFDKKEIETFKKNYENSSDINENNISIIFDKWLEIIQSINDKYDKYYFKINDGDINPKNIVDSDALVFIIKINVNENMDFNEFLKRIYELERICKEIENDVKIKCNTNIKILLDM